MLLVDESIYELVQSIEVSGTVILGSKSLSVRIDTLTRRVEICQSKATNNGF